MVLLHIVFRFQEEYKVFWTGQRMCRRNLRESACRPVILQANTLCVDSRFLAAGYVFNREFYGRRRHEEEEEDDDYQAMAQYGNYMLNDVGNGDTEQRLPIIAKALLDTTASRSLDTNVVENNVNLNEVEDTFFLVEATRLEKPTNSQEEKIESAIKTTAMPPVSGTEDAP